MNTPHLYQVSDLVDHCQSVKQEHPEAGWIPARPLGFQGFSLKRRLKLAWGVFVGRYDAVFWEPTLFQVGRAYGRQLYLDQVDLSNRMPPVEDQGEVNSGASIAMCAAMAATGLEGIGGAPFMYYNERAIEEHHKQEKS